MSSKINVSTIFHKHLESLGGKKKKYLKEDKWIFLYSPVLISIFLIIVIKIPSDKLIEFFTLILSIFIGLFLNLLVLIISFSENKLNIKDKKNRKKLLKQTFYNISYTILMSFLGLGLIFLGSLNLLPVKWKISLEYLQSFFFNLPCEIELNRILNFFFFFLFYIVFLNIILTLLMVIKRIVSLFDKEIENSNY